MNAQATVVVVSWNTRELLADCLDALRPSFDEGLIEALVVDNGSSDGSAELVAESFGWAQLVSSAQNLGFGAAVNLGARSAPKREWLIAANADTIVRPGALPKLLEAGRRHPTAAALAPRLVLPDGSTQESVFAFPRLGVSAMAAAGLHTASARFSNWMFRRGWDPRAEAPVEWAMGALLAIRRDAFDEVGGFDDEQWMYGEDLDICWRLKQLGRSTVYVPAAIVDHVGGASARKQFDSDDRRTAEVLAAQQRWLRKRRGALAAGAMAAINLGGAAARSAAWRLARPLGTSRVRSRDANAKAWLALNLEAVRRAR